MFCEYSESLRRSRTYNWRVRCVERYMQWDPTSSDSSERMEQARSRVHNVALFNVFFTLRFQRCSPSEIIDWPYGTSIIAKYHRCRESSQLRVLDVYRGSWSQASRLENPCGINTIAAMFPSNTDILVCDPISTLQFHLTLTLSASLS